MMRSLKSRLECSALAFLTLVISCSNISCVTFHFAVSASALPA